MTVTAYYQTEKRKSRDVLEAFVAGCGGRMVPTSVRKLEPGPAAFYGVRPPWKHLWLQAQADGRQTYYLDNAWFDCTREHQFRVATAGRIQSWSERRSDGSRLRSLGVSVAPWRRAGAHVVVTPQSDEFMAAVAGIPDWLQSIERELHQRTERLLRIRRKGCREPLAEDLRGAWLLVAHSSSAAVEALLAGIPVIVTDPRCAAARFSSRWDQIDCPAVPEGREEWAAQLADSQWTLEEMRAGVAWRALH